MISILIIDDEYDYSISFKRTLIKYKIAGKENIITVSNRQEALSVLLNNSSINLIFLDYYLEKDLGDNIVSEILSIYPDKYIVILTGAINITNAVSCIKTGAKDYICKTTPINELVDKIKSITYELISSDQSDIVNLYPSFQNYITCSNKIFNIFRYIKNIANSSEHILITGESGVGKGIIAKIIADIKCAGMPYVPVNIAAYDDQMFADALFGHVKGGFTGAVSDKTGIISKGENGIIFLDEIGDLSLSSQLKLLYLIQERVFSPIGSSKEIRTNAKFIFATNQDLNAKMRDKTFRHDLYYRLTTHSIHIPPLRERPEDIELLAKYFTKQAAIDLCKEKPILTQSFLDKLKTMYFSGNIRQLRSLIIDLVARYNYKLDECHIPSDEGCNIEHQYSSMYSMDMENIPTIEEVSTMLIKKAMIKTNYNQVKAASLLGISQPTLSRKWKEINN